jgi:hypothetical protein
LHADAIAKVREKIAEGKWRKDMQAKDWMGYAVANALHLALLH